MNLDDIIQVLSSFDDVDPSDDDLGPGEPDGGFDDGDQLYGLDLQRLFRAGDDFGIAELSFSDWIGADLPLGLRPDSEVGRRESPSGAVNWDVCAWYAPITFYGHGFGIFIRQPCIVRLAQRLGPWVYPTGHRLSIRDTLVLLTAALVHFYLHEQLHHKVESFAIRVAVAERRDVYRQYSRRACGPARNLNPSLLLEEGLAGADSYRRLSEPKYGSLVAASRTGVREFLDAYFLTMPPGYDLAGGLLRRNDYNQGEARLQASVHEATWSPSLDWNRWAIATHMLRSIYTVDDRIWMIVPAGSRPVLPSTGPAATESTRVVRRLLERLGYTSTGRGKGSHEVWTKPGSGWITLPARKDLTPGFLSDLAKKLGYPSTDALVRAARSI